MVLDGNSLQEYPVNAGVPKGSILNPGILYINDLVIYADDTTLYSKCDQPSDMWQQLQLASELESDLREIVNCCRKWLVDFSAG